ncbi:MAG: 1-acyl-sn-glycerol-3-phosphate acyltransferase [Acidobacteria bacterium]|nr:1-acyl-sn-glycerol-3-phosphate acyltransferase [Acidobacteriota bacterium]
MRGCRNEDRSHRTPPKPPFFLVCNHLSYVDIPTLRCVVEGVFVAKREIRDWPVAGRIISDFGQIFIDRTNRRDIPRAGTRIVRTGRARV